MNIENAIFPIGTYMLVWFTNPNKHTNEMMGVEQGLCTQFYNSLRDAKMAAEMLSGSRMILMCTAQNPSPSSNVYWSSIKKYGNPFNLDELTVMSPELNAAFNNKESLIKYLKEAKQKGWTLDVSDLMNRFRLDEQMVRNCVDLVYIGG